MESCGNPVHGKLDSVSVRNPRTGGALDLRLQRMGTVSNIG